VKELSRQQSLGINFSDCQLEAWVLGALKGSLLIEKVLLQVPISGLVVVVPLSMVYGSGVH